MQFCTRTKNCVSYNNHAGLLGCVAHEMRLALKRENWDNFRVRCFRSCEIITENPKKRAISIRDPPSSLLLKKTCPMINNAFSLSLSKEKEKGKEKERERDLLTISFAFYFWSSLHSFSSYSFCSFPRRKTLRVNRAHSFAPERPASRTHE